MFCKIIVGALAAVAVPAGGVAAGSTAPEPTTVIQREVLDTPDTMSMLPLHVFPLVRRYCLDLPRPDACH